MAREDNSSPLSSVTNSKSNPQSSSSVPEHLQHLLSNGYTTILLRPCRAVFPTRLAADTVHSPKMASNSKVLTAAVRLAYDTQARFSQNLFKTRPESHFRKSGNQARFLSPTRITNRPSSTKSPILTQPIRSSQSILSIVLLDRQIPRAYVVAPVTLLHWASLTSLLILDLGDFLGA